MKKLLLPLVLLFALLAGCQSEGLHIKKLNKIPKKLDEAIYLDAQFQLISDGNKGRYIVYLADEEVEARVEGDDNIAKVIFDKNTQGSIPNVFKLSLGEEHDSIMLIVDGEETPFNLSRGM